MIHLSVFFVCVLMCHGELARRRPPPRYLTGYYMWISFGGMIGGILTGLVAPHVFNWIAEYPILLLLTVLCRPGLSLPTRGSGQYALFAALGGGLLMLGAALAFDLRPQWSAALCAGRSPDRPDGAVLADTVAVRRHSRDAVPRQPVVPAKARQFMSSAISSAC